MSDQRTIRQRFPPPWTVDSIPGGFVVTSANSVRLAYVYVTREGLTVGEAKAVAEAIRLLAERAPDSRCGFHSEEPSKL